MPLKFFSLFILGVLFFTNSSNLALADSQEIVPITDYKIIGEGEETLVIIPCFSCRWKSFEPFMERNIKRYKMLAVTLPGHGGTGFPEIPLNTAGTPWHDNAWRAVAELIEENGIKNAVLITHSFGTDIGVHLAYERPDLVKTFIAIDSNPTDPPDQGQKSMTERLETANEYREKYMEPLMDPDAWINFNAVRSIKNPDRRFIYHGMFVSTEKEVVFQYWRENLLQDINPMFKALKMPYFDLQTLSSSKEDQNQAKVDHLEALEAVGVPEGYQAAFIHKSSHFMMEERPAVLDRMIEEIVIGGIVPEDWWPAEGAE